MNHHFPASSSRTCSTTTSSLNYWVVLYIDYCQENQGAKCRCHYFKFIERKHIPDFLSAYIHISTVTQRYQTYSEILDCSAPRTDVLILFLWWSTTFWKFSCSDAERDVKGPIYTQVEWDFEPCRSNEPSLRLIHFSMPWRNIIYRHSFLHSSYG